jgi:hypothetical protein
MDSILFKPFNILIFNVLRLGKFKYLFNTFLKQYKIHSVHIKVIKQKWEKHAIFLQVIITHNDNYNIWIHIECIIQ